MPLMLESGEAIRTEESLVGAIWVEAEEGMFMVTGRWVVEEM